MTKFPFDKGPRKMVDFLCLLLVLTYLTYGTEAISVESSVGITEKSTITLNIIDVFVDDVFSLLPDTMQKLLGKNLPLIREEAHFDLAEFNWTKQVLGKNSFESSYCTVGKKIDGRELSQSLGRSVKHIFGIAFSSNGYDPLNEGLQENLKPILRSGVFQDYKIEYAGYNGKNIDSNIDYLYDLRKHKKTMLYPELVTTTANLWTAIWKSNGGEVESTSQTFVRKSFDVEMLKMMARVSRATPSYSPSSPSASSRECYGSGRYQVCVDSYRDSNGDIHVTSYDTMGNSYNVDTSSYIDSRGGIHVRSYDSRGNSYSFP